MVSLLVELGGDINPPADDPSPEGPLLDAASEGAVKVVQWLLDHGAKINHQVGGVTRCLALSRAAWEGHLKVVRLLVEHGADINAVWNGQNALGFAIMYGQKEIEAYLRSKGAKEPSELQGYEPPPEPTDPILAHIEEHLGKPNPLSLQEIVPCDPSIAIHVVPMEDELALVTNGMSSRPLKVPKSDKDFRYAELVIYLPPDWPLGKKALDDPKYFWPFEWLRSCAYYIHENHISLGRRPTIIANGEPPEPLAPNMKMTCLLVLLDELDDFRWLDLGRGRRVAFYFLMPLYTEERDLEREKGMEHLMRLFDKNKIDRVVDIKRPNVVLATGGPRRGSRRK
jgi:hypothetical protein